MNDRDSLDPALPVDDDGASLAGAIRLLVLIAIFLILPLVLMAATMTSRDCGGG